MPLLLESMPPSMTWQTTSVSVTSVAMSASLPSSMRMRSPMAPRHRQPGVGRADLDLDVAGHVAGGDGEGRPPLTSSIGPVLEAGRADLRALEVHEDADGEASTPLAADRPSAIAHTISDWPRPASPATKTPGTTGL
jgi:hypothetical protein